MNKPYKSVAFARALLRQSLGHQSDAGRVDLLRLAGRLGLEIRELAVDGFDGALVRAREIPCGTILIRRSIREQGRKNFTTAHEIGHYLLPGHDPEEVICAQVDIGNWGDQSKQIEREADDFAAELLMPTVAVRSLIASWQPSLALIERIAQRFGSSLSAAAWRYCDLVHEPCAIVWSTDGGIAWCKRSQKFGFPLYKGARVLPETFASLAFVGAKIPRQPQVVPASLWTSGAATNVDLWEQSKALPAYRSVITLLWIHD